MVGLPRCPEQTRAHGPAQRPGGPTGRSDRKKKSRFPNWEPGSADPPSCWRADYPSAYRCARGILGPGFVRADLMSRPARATAPGGAGEHFVRQTGTGRRPFREATPPSNRCGSTAVFGGSQSSNLACHGCNSTKADRLDGWSGFAFRSDSFQRWEIGRPLAERASRKTLASSSGAVLFEVVTGGGIPRVPHRDQARWAPRVGREHEVRFR